MNPHAFLNQLVARDIKQAIHRAERQTSGEIRVFVSRHEAPDPVAAANAHFRENNMDQTRQRNAILIFIAPASQTFAIVGDVGIHERCGPKFWEILRDEMRLHLKNRRYTQSILHAIHRAGLLLAEHFPPDASNPNELPDDVLHD